MNTDDINYMVCQRETGTMIEKDLTLAEAQTKVFVLESEDMETDEYEPDFYEIIEQYVTIVVFDFCDNKEHYYGYLKRSEIGENIKDWINENTSHRVYIANIIQS